MIARIVFACLALFLACGSASVRAQQAVIDPTPIELASDQLEKSRAQLGSIQEQVDKFKDDDTRLVDLKVQAEELNRAILAISVGTRPRLDAIKARQTELGDPPAEGAAPEADIVVEERKKLTIARNEINALTGEAENLSIEATKLANTINEIRRRLFTDTLLRRTEISGDLFSEAGKALVVEGEDLTRTISSWLTFVWKFKRMSLFGALFLSVAAALVFVSGSYRLFSPYLRRGLRETKPGYLTRLTVAFWATMIPTLAVAAFAGSSYLFLDRFNVLRPDIAPLVSLALGVGVVFYFVTKLANAVLAPGDGDWRLVRVSDRGATMLSWAIFTMALVNVADYLFGGISEVLGSPIVLTVVKSFAASIVIGLVLIATAFIKPVLNKGESPGAHGHPWPRTIATALIVTGIGLILASVLGYVGMARFVATQIVITGAVLVAMYIGFLSGKTISAPNAFGETAIGRRIDERFGLGQVTMDQIGLAAGLAIQAMVLVFFVPLILMQWGFQVEDIESWAYRIFTQIKIGSITISLVGILGGLLLFAGGYALTRWFQKWLDGNVMARSHVDVGVRNSIKTAIGYAGIALAGLIGVSAAGIDLSSLALVAGALSLGIGFGLQNIVSNFVSGLILLAERPFKVGDWVATGTTEGFVKRISVRATEIETFQRQTIIVPNSVLINGSVGNWTHRNKLGRIDLPVSVHASNDPGRVMAVLNDLVQQQPNILRNPEPSIVFVNFSSATLDLEIRVFLADVLNGTAVKTQLRAAVLQRLRDEGIAIGAPAAPEVPIKIDPESARLISAIIETARGGSADDEAAAIAPPERRRARRKDGDGDSA